MLRSAAVIFSGNAANAGLLLIRNLLIARLISVEDYGIAATFAVAIAIIEMTSTFGLHQLLIQDRRGDEPEFQAALQGFHLVRGVINAGILFALAHPFASFMGVPEVAWAHQVLAVILLFNGLMHFDSYRLNRDLRYGPAAVIAVLSPLGALVAVWPLYLIWGDYRVMLWSMVIHGVSITLASHWVAERPYRVRFDAAVIRQGLRFGWPLLIDGLLLFAIYNGDKLIVGREFGMAPLALFAMAVTLTLTPQLILQRTGSSFFLPQLSAPAEPAARAALSEAALQAHLVAGGLMLSAVMLCGPPFVGLVLGEKYAPMLPLLTLLAVMQALRLWKGGPATVALARGRTANSMAANIARVAVLPLAWYAATTGGSMTLVLWIGILGEAVGLIVALWLLRHQTGLGLGPVLWPLLPLAALAALAGVAGSGVDLPQGAMLLQIPLLGAALFLSGALRHYIRQRRMTHPEG